MSNFMENFPIGNVQAIAVSPTDTSDLVLLPRKDTPDIMIVNEGTVTAFVRVGSIGSPVPAANFMDWTPGGAVDGDTFTIDGRVYTFSDDLSAVFASSLLGLTGNVLNGETVTIGSDLYTFVNTLTAPMNASGALTLTTNPTADETFTLGQRTYMFKDELPFGGSPFEILIGSDEDDTVLNMQYAVAADPDFADKYGAGTVANQQATATAVAAILVADAIALGSDGNTVITTETMDDGSWTDPTLTGGVYSGAFEVLVGADADRSISNLVFAVNVGNIGAGTLYGAGTPPNLDVQMVDNGGETATATAVVAGAAGNAIPALETLTNGAWLPATGVLAGGVDAAPPDTLLADGTVNTSIEAMVAVINAQPSQEGILFGVGTTKNAVVSAADNNPIVNVSSKALGTSGNGTATVSSIAALTDWDAGTMTGGLDASGAVEADVLGMPVIGGEKGVYNIGKDLLSTNRPLALAFITAAGTTDLSIVQGHGA